jgi:hypothetical protein
LAYIHEFILSGLKLCVCKFYGRLKFANRLFCVLILFLPEILGNTHILQYVSVLLFASHRHVDGSKSRKQVFGTQIGATMALELGFSP